MIRFDLFRPGPRRAKRGQTLVEFALILPILILVLVGVFDAGRAVYAFNTVNNAAREGVRVAIVDQNCSAIGQRARNHAASLDVTWTWDASLSPAARCQNSASDIHVRFLDADYSGNGTTNPCAAGQTPGPHQGCVAEVSVEYHYTAATPIIGNLLGTLTLVGTSQQSVESSYQSP